MMTNAWSKLPQGLKGVQPGEQFQQRMLKFAAGEQTPVVITGQLQSVTKDRQYRKRPLVLILVDNDKFSNHFLSETLTNEHLVPWLDEKFHLFGLFKQTSEGRAVADKLNVAKCPSIIVFYSNVDENKCEIIAEQEGNLNFENVEAILMQAEEKFKEHLP